MLREAGKQLGESIPIDEDGLDEDLYNAAREKASKIIGLEKSEIQAKKMKGRTGGRRITRKK